MDCRRMIPSGAGAVVRLTRLLVAETQPISLIGKQGSMISGPLGKTQRVRSVVKESVEGWNTFATSGLSDRELAFIRLV